MEEIFVRVKIGNKKFVIGSIYIPPRSSIAVYIHHIEVIKKIVFMYANHDWVFFGDFDLPNLI